MRTPPAASPRPAACKRAPRLVPVPQVSSSLPVLELGSALTGPDDLLFHGGDLLVGETQSGLVLRLSGGTASLAYRLPGVEGLAELDGSLYAADQPGDRVLRVSPDPATLINLVPVTGIEGVDGLAAGRGALVVPDSARGQVLEVSPSGRVLRRWGGLARPAGAWALADGSVLVADENLGEVLELNPDGSRLVVMKLPLADDVVAYQGAVFAISISQGTLVEALPQGPTVLVRGLASPQGLAADGAGNLMVAESGAGRVDEVVLSFALDLGGTVTVSRGQPICIGIDRAPGFTGQVSLRAGPGFRILRQPGRGVSGEIEPAACASECRLEITATSGLRLARGLIAYRQG